jgi:hypothetical protein
MRVNFSRLVCPETYGNYRGCNSLIPKGRNSLVETAQKQMILGEYPPVATAAPLSQTLFAIITYPIHITGGTGKFAGATGDLTNIGEVDLGAKATVFRYSGQVCFAEQD